MPRRRKQSISFGRIALFVALILAVLAGVWAWQHRARVQSIASTISTELPLPVQNAGSAPPTPNAVAEAAKVSGKLSIHRPPRDAQLGVSADAAILLRIVEMYQWTERCDGANCRYEQAWSGAQIDSSKFRTPAGHRNPPAPFADARFIAGEIKLGDLSVDPKLLNTQAAVEYRVSADSLPPNLEATFSVIDGALYAGGDAAHPQVGTVRVRYRIVPAGEVELSGILRGNRLEAK